MDRNDRKMFAAGMGYFSHMNDIDKECEKKLDDQVKRIKKNDKKTGNK